MRQTAASSACRILADRGLFHLNYYSNYSSTFFGLAQDHIHHLKNRLKLVICHNLCHNLSSVPYQSSLYILLILLY